MPSRVIGSNAAETQASQKTRKGLRTVLGFHSSNTSNSANPPPVSASSLLRSAQTPAEKEKSCTLRERRSVDVTSSDSSSYFVSVGYGKKARTREGRESVTDISFFQPNPTSPPLTPKHTSVILPPLTSLTVNLNSPDSKQKTTKMSEIPQERASRRKLARIEAQDGPWSVSVAESPYDKNSYSIYIKTPTNHMTLTRTGQEIQDLHRKITSAHADITLPDVPLQSHDENVENFLTEKKRKSSFLHTLSRLASPSPIKRERPRDIKVPNLTANSGNSMVNGAYATGLPLSQSIPGKDVENWDTFTSPLADANSATSTALAGYLTTLANEPALKHSKAWWRFVRIRTDDLISERVERAVKRVRSDLAAHLSGSKYQSRKADVADDTATIGSVVIVGSEKEVVDLTPHQAEESTGGIIGEIKEEEEEDVRRTENGEGEKRDEVEVAAQELPGTPRPRDTMIRGSIEIPDAPEVAGAKSVSTPTETNAAIANRIPRSQSADPDKAMRMSRIFEASPMKNDGDESAAEYESEAQAETEVEEAKSTTTVDDDSSISTSGAKRKSNRSKSAMRIKGKLRKKTKASKKVIIDDFEMMRVLGKGCAGKVLLVRHKKSESLYALKAITKRHVLAHQELQHTLTEQAVLRRMTHDSKDPFVVKLYWSFHDKENLFLVMDFHPGGDLATQLARWGRLGRDRARFYAAEIVEGVDGLHAAGVIYRDLKPENILIGADGHIVLTDFGLSKEFPRRTSPITAPATPSGSRSDFHAAQQPLPHWMKGEDNSWPIGQNDTTTTTTFCGTAEYLAPEVIQGQPYSYEVDWWSFGTMLYEMLTGITPFWANNHSEMYVRVLQDELKFPDDRVMDQDTKSLIRGLLQRNPALRIKQPRIKRHPYFSMIDWSHVYYKRYIPPYIPPIDPLNASDTQNFDDTFLDMEPVIADENEQGESGEDHAEGGEKSDGENAAARTPAQSRRSSVVPQAEEEADLFDGYSFKGRHSVLIDDEDEDAEVEDEDEDVDEIDDEEDIQRLANATVGEAIDGEGEPADEASEPKTPEARKSELPELTTAEKFAALHKAVIAAAEAAEPSTPIAPSVPSEKTPEVVSSRTEEAEQTPPSPHTPQAVSVTKPAPSAVASRSIASARGPRARREKSGIHALDKYLSDGGDADDDAATERDEDDDWDFVEAPGAGAEDRNGAKGSSLFARGVVDRYKLAVFRKASTPGKNAQNRNVSGMSFASDITTSDATSPSPSDKRRGRTPGLTFRRHPKQFLRARSPPSATSSNGTGKTLVQQSNSNTVSSVTSNSAGLLTPCPSTHPSTIAGQSLRSKESTMSMGSPGSSDDQSLNGDGLNASISTDLIPNGAQAAGVSKRVVTIDEPEKPKTKKLKKYKEGAEKVLSLFASPRQ